MLYFRKTIRPFLPAPLFHHIRVLVHEVATHHARGTKVRGTQKELHTEVAFRHQRPNAPAFPLDFLV